MTSVVLARAGNGIDALAVVATMLSGMKDRSPEQAASGSSSAAVGAGASTPEEARHALREVGTDVLLSVDAPAWLADRLDEALAELDSREIAADPAPLVHALSGLAGDIHCVAVLGSRGCLAYRGPLSPRPLFYADDQDGVLLAATQARGVLAARPSPVSISGLAPFLVPQMCDPASSAWEGVHRLPPGHLLLSWDGVTEVRPVARVEAEQADGADHGELVAGFRQRLLQAVARCSGRPDAILLSGGIDSSSLACAYSLVQGSDVRAFALTYDARLAPCDERRYVDDVEAATGMPVSRLAGNRLLPLVAGYPEADEPEPWAYAARNWAMLRHIAASPGEPVATVIAGEGGDELLLGQVFAVADRYAAGDPVGARREIGTFPDPGRVSRVIDGLLSGAYDRAPDRMRRALGDVPPWLSSGFVADTGMVDRLARSYPRLGEPGQMAVRYSRALINEAGAAGRVQCGGWWEDAGRKAGVKLTYPFLDPDLAAFTWALPPRMLRDQGLEKAVLREALGDVLPDSVARRRDKAEALALMHAGLRERADVLRSVAQGGPLADYRVIRSDRLLASIDDYLNGRHELGPALWATAATDRWLTGQSGHAVAHT